MKKGAVLPLFPPWGDGGVPQVVLCKKGGCHLAQAIYIFLILNRVCV